MMHDERKRERRANGNGSQKNADARQGFHRGDFMTTRVRSFASGNAAEKLTFLCRDRVTHAIGETG